MLESSYDVIIVFPSTAMYFALLVVHKTALNMVPYAMAWLVCVIAVFKAGRIKLPDYIMLIARFLTPLKYEVPLKHQTNVG